MRMRNLLPLVGLLALGACNDEKKAEKPNPANPPVVTTPAPPPPPASPAPGAPVTPSPAQKPAGQ